MSARGDVIAARETLVRAVLELLGAERMVHMDASAMTKVNAAENKTYLAARDLADAVAELLPAERPKGWARHPSEETA